MRHAFLMNIHRDQEQAEVTIALLKKWYPDSGLFLYLDGPSYPPELIPRLRRQSELLEWRAYEPDKNVSSVRALNVLLHQASERGVQIASFLHADMFFTDRDTFARFLDRFQGSGKMMAYAPMWPGHRYLSFCDLHFNLPEFHKARILPFGYTSPSKEEECNEAFVTYHLRAWDMAWQDYCYHLWTIVRPYTGESNPCKHGHQANMAWIFHNYTPETSMIHTNDSEFYANIDKICR